MDSTNCMRNEIVKKFETSLKIHLWLERWNFLVILFAIVIGMYEKFTISKMLELAIGGLLFTGIVLLGFIAIALHVQYYFYLERNRKVELLTDRLIITNSDQTVIELSINDVAKITIFDRLRTFGYKSDGYDSYHNLYPSFADSFYYLILVSKNNETVVLTSLLDITLKKKIALWYKKGIEHKYQFLPFLTITK